MTSPTTATAPTTLALIAAVARNGAIGRGNALLWHEPLDQKHFRASTLGCPVIMGRKTWDSLPARFRPLPGRRNLVLSRDPALQLPGAEVLPSLDAALAAVAGATKAFVIGGAELYALALPHADELVLTEVHADLDGDTFFPPWPRQAFELQSREPHTPASGPAFDFAVYRRRR